MVSNLPGVQGAVRGVLAVAVGTLLIVGCGSPQTPSGASAPAPATATMPPPTATPVPPTATPAPPKDVTVFAAASLTDAFKEIGTAFEQETPGAKVVFNFGATNQLRTQLEQGARADVFASANQAEMTRAVESKVVVGQPQVFAKNRLVAIVPKDNPGKVMTLNDLGRKGLKVVTTDKAVPIGQYTLDMLDKMAKDTAYGEAYKTAVLANVVSYENNVRQVVAKVRLGEADAGVVYATDVTPDVAAAITTIAVPDSFNTLATYPLATVANAPQAELGGKFVAFVTGVSGQAILKKYGFIDPK